MARHRRPRAVPLQPALRRPLRGQRGLRRHRRARERLLSVEVGRPVLRGRGAGTLRRRTPGPGATHRGAAGPGDAAGRPARLRGLRAGPGQGGQEAAPLPAVPRGVGGHATHPLGEQARGARRRGLAHPGVGQVADHAVAGDQDPPRAALGQRRHRGGHRPHPAGQANIRHLQAVRLPGAGADGPIQAGAGGTPRPADGGNAPAAPSPSTCRQSSSRAAAAR